MRREIGARRFEHALAEADPLIFRRQIKFEDLAAVAERRHAIAAVAGVAGDGVGEVEHDEPRARADRLPPPGGTAPLDHALELTPGDDAAIRVAPRRIVHARDALFVAEPRHPNRYECLHHAERLRPAPPKPQGLDRRAP